LIENEYIFNPTKKTVINIEEKGILRFEMKQKGCLGIYSEGGEVGAYIGLNEKYM